MSLLASQLAADAAATIEQRDVLSSELLVDADQEVDTLRRHLLSIVFAKDWAARVTLRADSDLAR